MTIDTFLPGSPVQLRAAAEWLTPTLTGGTFESSDTADVNRMLSQGSWVGASGAGYLEVLNSVYIESIDVETWLRDSAEKLRSYAGQLERMGSDFAGLCDDARSAGLRVSGTVIHPPISVLSSCPVEGDPDYPAYERYVKRVETYNTIATEVGTRWGELEVWTAANITDFLGTVPAESALSGVLGAITDVATSFGVEVPITSRAAYLEGLKEAAALQDADAAAHRKALNSGNPAVKAAARAISGTPIPGGNGLRDVIPEVARNTRWIPGVGWVLEGIGFGVDVSNGGSPSSGLTEIAGGVAGGILAGAGLTALAAAGVVTLPVWGTVAVVAGATVAAGAGAVWAYENWVDQDVREAIDAGIGDAWEWGTDFVSDGWNWATGNG